MSSFTQLPDNLPTPIDDGACDHLTGESLPDITLLNTRDESINLRTLEGLTVIYIYPMTGQPGTPLPEGWDMIPGARGCTPQSCAFRDHQQELAQLGAKVYGISNQPTEDQHEAKQRLHLPFELLSDRSFNLKETLKLPTFYADKIERYKRITLICQNQTIIKVFYPVFPPDKNAEEVIAWLQQRSTK